MNTIIGEFGKNPKFIEILNNINNKKSPIAISGLIDVGIVGLTSAIHEFGKQPICILTYNELQAKKLYESLKYFTEKGNRSKSAPLCTERAFHLFRCRLYYYGSCRACSQREHDDYHKRNQRRTGAGV